MMNVWLNGELCDSTKATNRGLAYGDGVFETLLFHAGGCAQLNQHITRLKRGLTVLGIDHPDLSYLEKLYQEAASAKYSILKLIAYRRGAASGYAFDDRQCDVFAILKPFEWSLSAPVAIAVSNYPLVSDARLAGIKHLNRLQQVLAAQEAISQGVDDLILMDADEYVIEAISSNVFFMIDGRWYTPDLNCQGVAGVMRQSLLASAQNFLGQDVIVENIPIKVALGCQAAFLCNSVRGVMPVKTINGRVIDISPCEPIVKKVSQYLHA